MAVFLTDCLVNANACSIDSFAKKAKNKLQHVAQETFKKFDKAWSYAGKSILLTRHVLNATVRSCRWVALTCGKTTQKIQATILRLKLFSIFSVPLNAAMIPALVNKIWKNMHWGDGKGTALSTLSCVVVLTDIVDSLSTFTNAILQTFSKEPIAWVSGIGMPLAFSLVGMGSVSRIVKLSHLFCFLRDVDRKLLVKLSSERLNQDELKEIFEDFVTSKLPEHFNWKGELSDEMKQYQDSFLERQTNGKSAKLLGKMIEILKGHDRLEEKQIEEVLNIMEEVVDALHLERKLQGWFLAANLVVLIGLSLFYFPVAAVIPFLVLAVSMSMRLGGQFYQDLHS